MGRMQVFVVIPEKNTKNIKPGFEVTGAVDRLMSPYQGYDSDPKNPVFEAISKSEDFTLYSWAFKVREYPEFEWASFHSGPYDLQDYLNGNITDGTAAVITPNGIWMDVCVGKNYWNQMETILDKDFSPEYPDVFWERANKLHDKVMKDIFTELLKTSRPLKFVIVRCKI